MTRRHRQADAAEVAEFERASSKARDEMRGRHQAKVDAGVAVGMDDDS